MCILIITWLSMINITIHFPIFPHISFEPEPYVHYTNKIQKLFWYLMWQASNAREEIMCM
jgi:hypothetical protein